MPKSTNSSSSSNAREKKTTITISRRSRSKNYWNQLGRLYSDWLLCRKKERKAEAEEGKVTAEGDNEFKNLYKHFGPDHKNKDLRIQMEKKVNKGLTTKMGPLMQLNINPSFQIE